MQVAANAYGVPPSQSAQAAVAAVTAATAAAVNGQQNYTEIELRELAEGLPAEKKIQKRYYNESFNKYDDIK